MPNSDTLTSIAADWILNSIPMGKTKHAWLIETSLKNLTSEHGLLDLANSNVITKHEAGTIIVPSGSTSLIWENFEIVCIGEKLSVSVI